MARGADKISENVAFRLEDSAQRMQLLVQQHDNVARQRLESSLGKIHDFAGEMLVLADEIKADRRKMRSDILNRIGSFSIAIVNISDAHNNALQKMISLEIPEVRHVNHRITVLHTSPAKRLKDKQHVSDHP